jgi:hypothetical protein
MPMHEVMRNAFRDGNDRPRRGAPVAVRSRSMLAGVAVACVVLGGAGAAQASPGHSDFGRSHRPVCGAAPVGFARCNADVVTDAAGAPLATAGPRGYGPGDLRAAYGLSTLSTAAGGGQTLAIVDAYDDPNAESDLAVYRSQYGLPPCTTANGCFRKVNQRGSTAYPSANASWAQEISLDLDMASAICPNCHILLVEADSNSIDDLGAAVDRAAELGATQISNSYGGDEYRRETTDEAHYNHPGIAITASSGDSGYGVQFPAASRYVTAVGGTSLVRDASAPGGWTETAWSGAGSGCSAYVAKPAWQTDSGCPRRSVADVAAVADPETGVAVYDSLAYQGSAGWMVFGGTSVSAPIVAGFDALIGTAAATPSYPYAHVGSYLDIASGANGACTVTYLCTAGPDYDGPTGLGTIDGTPPAALPTATTTTASPIADTTATATATVNPNGTVTSVRFLYGTTTAYGSATAQQPAGSDTADHAISAPLSGLAPATTYHYRAVATTDCGCRHNTSYGADASFTTAAGATAPSNGGAGSASTGGGTATGTVTSGGSLDTTADPAVLTATGPTSAPGAAPALTGTTARATRRSAKLKIRRATITRGKLDAVVAITRLAAGGKIRITFRAHHHTIHFSEKASHGRLRFTHKLPTTQRHAPTGMLTITYAGDHRVRPARARIRAKAS